LDAANVILKAERDMTLTGSPFSLILSDDDLDNNRIGSSSILLQAGRNFHLIDFSLIGLGAKLQAASDVRVENATISSNGCGISAGGNVYLTDSVFIGSCHPNIPGRISAGGQINVTNTLFF
jgi:hypothetical protein